MVAGDTLRARRLDTARLAAQQRICHDALTDPHASYGRPDFDDVTDVFMPEDEGERRERRRRRTRFQGDDVQIAAADPSEPRPDANPTLARQCRFGHLSDRGARVWADIETPRQPTGRERR